MQERKTVGQIYQDCLTDSTRYDPLEVGHEITDRMAAELNKCVEKHLDILDVPEFCVGMLICDDNIVNNVKRIKYYAWPFLPEPRPRQTVFWYRRSTDQLTRIWSLPDAKTMAHLASMQAVSKEWMLSKFWVDTLYQWFNGLVTGLQPYYFYEVIRRQTGCKMLSEKEHVAQLVNSGQKASSSCHDQIDTLFPETFDAFKPFESKVVHPNEIIT